jgi:hypothetical protein
MANKQEFLKLLNDFDKTPSITLREWQRVLNHILNNLVNGTYVSTTARNVSIDDAGSYFATDQVEFATQYLAQSLLNGLIRVTSKTDTAVLTDSEFGLILCNRSTAMSLTTPTASSTNTGKCFSFTNINTGKVTVTAGTLIFDLYQDENINIASSGSGWFFR